MVDAINLIDRGYAVLCPHLSLYLDERAKKMDIEIDYDAWIKISLSWLRVSDGVFCRGFPEYEKLTPMTKPVSAVGGTEDQLNLSRGVIIELDEAGRLGLPIFSSFDQLPYLR